MIRQKTLRGALLLVILPFFMDGCATKKAIPEGGRPPSWVNQGSGAFKDAGDQVFYGVGAVTGIRNKPLAKSASENRARAEIAKTFETYSASLMKDFTASTTGGGSITGASATSEEQYVEQAIKTFSGVTLNGVVIMDHWTDPADGTLYSLARLDLENFKTGIENIKELNSAVRDYVKKNAEKVFDDLAEEEKRQE